MRCPMRKTAFAVIICIASTFVLAAEEGFVDKFDVPKKNFKSTGKNTYFNLTPGYGCVYEGEEDGKKGHLEITVLDKTEQVDGVETRIVEERESMDGQLVEVSRNFFAVDNAT